MPKTNSALVWTVSVALRVRRFLHSVACEASLEQAFLSNIIKDAVTYAENGRRRTVTGEDMDAALKKNGVNLYGIEGKSAASQKQGASRSFQGLRPSTSLSLSSCRNPTPNPSPDPPPGWDPHVGWTPLPGLGPPCSGWDPPAQARPPNQGWDPPYLGWDPKHGLDIVTVSRDGRLGALGLAKRTCLSLVFVCLHIPFHSSGSDRSLYRFEGGTERRPARRRTWTYRSTPLGRPDATTSTVASVLGVTAPPPRPALAKQRTKDISEVSVTFPT